MDNLAKKKKDKEKTLMGGTMVKVVFTLLVTLAITFPCLEAGIAEFDDFLKVQAEQAREIALQSYIPTPELVAGDLNYHVHL